MAANEIDLDYALRTLNQLALEEGDQGYAYWSSISKLLLRAVDMQTEIDRLTRELDACRAARER